MGVSHYTAREARARLYDIFGSEDPFETKARRALDLGVTYLGADNGHLTRIDTQTDHWEAVVSTDPSDGEFPPGLTLELESTYCRRTLAADEPITLSDTPNQGWEDDPAFRMHGLHCYHGTKLVVDGAQYGTVCFVARDALDEPFSDEQTMFAELVTRLLERELEREVHEAELDRRATLVGVFNRVLRHNLRNDMSVVRGRLEHIRTTLSDDTHIQVAIDRIDRLIDLSDKARELDVEKVSNPTATDVTALVERVAGRTRQDYPAASITVEGPDAVTAPLHSAFSRALEELLENAAKHAGEAPTVSVSVGYVPHGVEVTVADNGPGLPYRERRVLETGAETPLTHGTGLGLWLIYWVVTSHGGTVDTDVSEGGTTMTLSVPRSPEPR